jgi:MoaA/NifB/PqqE/SkfB family radical SAM enzyme
MRFPLRLSAGLFKARVSSLLTGSAASRAILRISPGENALEHVSQTGSPVIWLSGTEPLLYPEIGRLANGLVELNRHVFLHTDACQLRQRIHEFRPDSRLFLTAEFAGREGAHNRAMDCKDAFQRTIEGIRAAKLSGFLVAAHFTVTSETDPCQIGELIESLDNRDVDGFIVSTGGKASAAHIPTLSESLDDTRAMIRCGRWENFSRLLEDSYAHTLPAHGEERLSASSESAYEEGD